MTMPHADFQAHLDDWSDELNQEAWQQHQGGIEGVKVVHDETLDVRPVMVLICHDHEVAISQLLHICIYLHSIKDCAACKVRDTFLTSI